MVAGVGAGMRSRFVEGLTPADVATLANALLGFLAVIVAFEDPALAARLILIAAVADGVDGVLARRFGGSDIGPYLDSLADVPSFAIAPAVLAYLAMADHSIEAVGPTGTTVLVAGVPALFVALAVLRLGVYTAHDTAETATIGAPTTLAATVLAAAMLTIQPGGELLVVGVAILAIAMVSPIEYPDLLARDALIMGIIHVLAVLFPVYSGRVFPYALLTLAIAYLVLGPWLYWGETERALRGPPSPKGKRS